MNLLDPWGLYQVTASGGAHLPFNIGPVAVGGSFSSEYNVSRGSLVDYSYKGFTPEAVAGTWADIGVSIGFSDLSGTGRQSGGNVISLGSGKYGGVQFGLRKEFDPCRSWYDPLKYVDAVSFGLGVGLGFPVNLTVPLEKAHTMDKR